MNTARASSANELKIPFDISFYRERVDEWLYSSLQSRPDSEKLWNACRYATLGAGKRFRPVLSLLVSEALGVAEVRIRDFCVAIELLHAATLVHDDLPALDDDELRRGKPTCHIEFGEDIALIAGDTLLLQALAFIGESGVLNSAEKIQLISLLAEAGIDVCRGQALDLLAERVGRVTSVDAEQELVERHTLKTARLIEAAAVAPTVFSPVELRESHQAALSCFGISLGMLFQVTDDILDEAGKPEETGKPVGSDAERGVPTFVSVHGLAGARELANQYRQAALAAIETLEGNTGNSLCHLVETTATRIR